MSLRLATLLALLPLSSGAQPCTLAATDATATARRARTALFDLEHLRTEVAIDQAISAHAGASAAAAHDAVAAHLLVANEQHGLAGYDRCDPTSSHLATGWSGGALVLGLPHHVHLEGHLLLGGDSLATPERAGHGYLMWEIEAELPGHTVLGVGRIAHAEARRPTDPLPRLSPVGHAHTLLHADAPDAHLSGDVLIDDEDGADFAALHLLPFHTPLHVAVGGDVLYERATHEMITGVEVEAPFWHEHVVSMLGAEAAWPHPHLKAFRWRTDLHLQAHALHHPPPAHGWGAGDVGGSVEVSRYSSPAVAASGDPALWGVVGSVYARAGFEGIVVAVAGMVGTNRVETLERLPDAGSHLEAGGTVTAQVGW